MLLISFFLPFPGGFPIYSISLHPSLQYIATSGGDSAIRLWNIQSILDESIEQKNEENKCAATMMHSAPVNVVKWNK